MENEAAHGRCEFEKLQGRRASGGSTTSRSCVRTCRRPARSISTWASASPKNRLPRRRRRALVRVHAAQGQPARHRVRQRRRPALPPRRLHGWRNCIASFRPATSPASLGFRPQSRARAGPPRARALALFVYFRDPDRHRIELFNTHYQMMDIENEPVRWNAPHTRTRAWGLPPRRQWHFEASRFAGVEPRDPAKKPICVARRRNIWRKAGDSRSSCPRMRASTSSVVVFVGWAKARNAPCLRVGTLRGASLCPPYVMPACTRSSTSR